MRVLLVVLLSTFIWNATSAQIYINEWMASNSSVIEDPDFNETGDWIELYNASENIVQLEGYYLTDNLDNPNKWVFPEDTKIAPSSYLIIWADGLDTDMHTSFKLTKAGEFIGLFNPFLELVDSVNFGHQKTNVSMGRQEDGSTSFAYFLSASPGASNGPISFEGITFHETNFSNRGGFYENPIAVELSSIDGEIRFTTDGSAPTQTSTLYTVPIEIDETTILRASIFQNNFISGKTITQSYFFGENFEERGLPVISISTEPGNFWNPDTGIYVQDFKPEWEYPINIELFENDGSNRAAFNELAGTKINGQNSWAAPHKMLGIYFDNDYDKNNLDYPLFFDNDRTSYDNFILRASGSDWNSTLVRDALCQELTKENMDLDGMDYRPCIVYINGEYLGIHNLRSRIDEGYIEENFGYERGTFDLIQNEGRADEGDNIAFFELQDFFANDLSVDETFEQLSSMMDVTNFTDYMMTQIWTGNSSWGHNIQSWRPRKEGAKWRWLMEDFDRGFVGIHDNQLDKYSFYTNPDSPYEWARVPLQNMFENEAYNEWFFKRFTAHLYTSFHPEQVTDLINEFTSKLAIEIPLHIDRWEGQSSSYGTAMSEVADWENDISELKDYAQGRHEVMFNNLIQDFELDPTIVDLALMLDPPEAGQLLVEDFPVPKAVWNGPYSGNMEFEVEAVPNYGYEFTGWTTGVSELTIESNTEWKYLDNGIEPPNTWKDLNYEDSDWDTGFTNFGYSDDDNTIETQLDYGDSSNNKHISYYFRKKFTLENIDSYVNRLQINIARDDGAIVYLNGEEIIRSNMPSGEINFETTAPFFVADETEGQFFPQYLQTNLLQEGENILAVEVHQNSANSTDIDFDLEMRTFRLAESDEPSLISNDALLRMTLSSDTFLIATFNQNETCILPRAIKEDLTLDLACSPYIAPYEVKVFPDAQLNIPAGVEIQFSKEAKLLINGSLNAVGAEDSMIVFKPTDDTESWGSIVLQNTTDINQIYWAEIKGATKGQHPVYEKAAISAFNSTVDLNHLQITEVLSNPILAYYSDVTLKNSELHSKITGDLINVKYGNAVIENCDFRGNFEVDTDAIDYDEVNEGIIRNCQIYDFLGFNSDGIDLGEVSTDIVIENNNIYNCTDKGVSIGQQSSLFAKNNTIVNCNQGFAIKDLSTAEIEQSTFYNTAIPIACFEKNIGLGGGMAYIKNSILSNAAEQTIYADPYSFIDIDHSLSDNDILTGTNNLFANPHFVNPTFSDFHLQTTSPAIGYGLNNLGDKIDLGATFQPFIVEPSLMISGINYYPTGNINAEFIQIFNPSNETINLEDYVLSKAIDFTFPPAQIAPGETIFVVLEASNFSEYEEQIFTWTDGRLSNEGEAIRLTNPYGIIVDQVTYDNKAPWPLEAEGMGGYLVLKEISLDNHFAESWAIEMKVFPQSPITNYAPIEVFPNPSSSFINIDSEKSDISSIIISNTAGQNIKQIEFNQAKKVKIDIQDLPKGMYFIQINGREQVQKFSVQ